SAFLLESETIVSLSKNEVSQEELTDEEFLVFEALQHQSSLHINDVRSVLDKKNVVAVLEKLLQK
ncbi:MAG TPA: hypothetical protein DEG69_13560, partial [Flavobacteriaceae bacterium]|nr:hypothetical protein [Flavobacteriaceae bacterium]